MNIESIRLKNKQVTDPQLARFLVDCIWQLDGFSGVIEAMVEKQLSEIAAVVLKAREYAYVNKNPELDLATVEAGSLRALCTAVVDVLDDYGDLEIIMVIDKKKAHRLLSML